VGEWLGMRQWVGLIILFCLVRLAPQAEGARAEAAKPQAINADRWMEIDLYWFDRTNITASSEAFWERYSPLFAGVQGWKGVMLNVGWAADYVTRWEGDLDQKIPFLKGIQQEEWFAVTGQLTGDTEERQRQWKQRFANPANHLKKYYQDWTYRELKELAASLREVAAKKYGLKAVKVGSFMVDWHHHYGSDSSPFSLRHPEVHANYGWPNSIVFGSRLKADHFRYAAYPQGIPEGTPIHEFLGAQWGSLSQAAGLDAILLRDSWIPKIAYTRKGPFGRTAPADPAVLAGWSQGAADFVRCLKQANPRALVVGYSSGACAVADWRVNCADLETIARQGYLDAWIDQTWAGAWNEVGVRKDSFWNTPFLGWTYQLQFVLMHAAVLANTKVHHYVLTETFDAWESWDIIHTAPERLRWGIWAYHHAALKTPQGLRMPAGTYISWGNQGTRLLAPEDVAWLRDNLNAAITDAAATREVFGPTVVYNRAAMAWQNAHAPNQEMKEWIDEQMGAVMKWGVPVASATRIEWLPKIHTDLPVLETPVHLSREEAKFLSRRIEAGEPVAIFASPANGVDSGIARLAGIASSDQHVGALCREARRGDAVPPSLGEHIPERFALYHNWTQNTASPAAAVLYTVNDSPALILNESAGRKILFWDPPEAKDDWRVSLRDEWGSEYPYVMAARGLHRLLQGSDSPFLRKVPVDQPLAISAWKQSDGSVRILAGNLEEGLGDSPDLRRHVTLSLPSGWMRNGQPLAWSNQWHSGPVVRSVELDLDLKQAQSALWTTVAGDSGKRAGPGSHPTSRGEVGEWQTQNTGLETAVP
jgi:hypothetical protein